MGAGKCHSVGPRVPHFHPPLSPRPRLDLGGGLEGAGGGYSGLATGFQGRGWQREWGHAGRNALTAHPRAWVPSLVADSLYTLQRITSAGDEKMAKRTKRPTTRAKQNRGKATRGIKTAARKTKRITARKPSKKRIGRAKPKAVAKKVGRAKPKAAAKKAAARKPRPQAEQQPAVATETVIVDVVEEPVPGVMVVSEFEATRELDSEEEQSEIPERKADQ
jgi:hypothetical protein